MALFTWFSHRFRLYYPSKITSPSLPFSLSLILSIFSFSTYLFLSLVESTARTGIQIVKNCLNEVKFFRNNISWNNFSFIFVYCLIHFHAFSFPHGISNSHFLNTITRKFFFLFFMNLDFVNGHSKWHPLNADPMTTHDNRIYFPTVALKKHSYS